MSLVGNLWLNVKGGSRLGGYEMKMVMVKMTEELKKDTDYSTGCFLGVFAVRKAKLNTTGTSKPMWIYVHGAVLT